MDASLDPLCSTTNSKNCQNYNFISSNCWTATANTKDSVSVYYIDEDEGILYSNAYIPKAIRPVITLKNDVLYISGSGTEMDPMQIK